MTLGKREKYNVLRFGKRRRGAATLEFVFAFSLLTILFIIIISFQIVVMHRIAAAYSVWRIQRVEGILNGNGVFVKKESNAGLFGREGFGDLVVYTLKDSNIKVEVPKSEQSEYVVKYDTSLLNGLLKFYYGKNAPKYISDNIDWFEPKPPPDVGEHNK